MGLCSAYWYLVYHVIFSQHETDCNILKIWIIIFICKNVCIYASPSKHLKCINFMVLINCLAYSSGDPRIWHFHSKNEGKMSHKALTIFPNIPLTASFTLYKINMFLCLSKQGLHKRLSCQLTVSAWPSFQDSLSLYVIISTGKQNNFIKPFWTQTWFLAYNKVFKGVGYCFSF